MVTAVEWLEEKFNKTNGQLIDLDFREALAMEKQQIVDAINLPREKRWYNALLYNNSGEQYYNKTYGK